jgi:glucose-1-phosphate cytidylyltransferase
VKAVILAGGQGTRMGEETVLRPKPLVEVGGRPIIWHILKHYHFYGISDFIICAGYAGKMIADHFANEQNSDWNVQVVDTGLDTGTGGRLKRIRNLVGNSTFCMTYGDGVADVDVAAAIAFHREHGKLATVTAVQPPGRYGALQMAGNEVRAFTEKPTGDGGLINGGFFVLSPKCLDRIAGDDTSWEGEPLSGLAADGELMAFPHLGFWQPMDTLREKTLLEHLWDSGEAPWKVW